MNESENNNGENKPKSLIRNAEHFEIMRAVAGRIAAEIAEHLTPLTAYPQVISQGMDPENDSLEFVFKMERSAKEIDFIVRQLLLLSDKTRHEDQMVDINAIVDKTVVQMKKRADVFARSVQCELEPDLAEVEGAPDEISDAIENLCSNAVESLTQGGKVVIRARNVSLDDYVSDCGLPLKAGNYVRISVEDSGSGIPDSIKDRIFEPFVTSKKITGKRHAGLGLTVAFKIMMNHEGGIDYRSAPGGGSTFALLFPAAKTGRTKSDKMQSETVRSASLVPRNRDRVMVVDNDRTILRLFKMILSEALTGVKLDFAEDGEGAVEKFDLKHHAIIVMDIRMPGTDGYSAFNRIKQICDDKNWELPSVIFCTGFPVPKEVTALVTENPAHSLLTKPIKGQTLIDTVKAHI